MKKIVPFKKEIPFDTNIGEINSISLEHTLQASENNLIEGEFIISGDYKMTDTSITLDTFEYKLPFNINFDQKYNIKNAVIDICDFYYEVINNKILSVNIEVQIEGIGEYKEDLKEEIKDTLREVKEISKQEETPKDEEKEEKSLKIIENPTNEKRCIEDEQSTLFENIISEEQNEIYKIHIVRENDTIETIIEKYNVTKQDLEKYNNLQEIKIGDKIIVPSQRNII